MPSEFTYFKICQHVFHCGSPQLHACVHRFTTLFLACSKKNNTRAAQVMKSKNGGSTKDPALNPTERHTHVKKTKRFPQRSVSSLPTTCDANCMYFIGVAWHSDFSMSLQAPTPGFEVWASELVSRPGSALTGLRSVATM